MRIAPVADIKARFSAYLKASQDGPIIVKRKGRPVAVLLSIEDEDELERLILAYSPKFQSVLAAAKSEILEGKDIPHEEFWQDVETEPSEGEAD